MPAFTAIATIVVAWAAPTIIGTVLGSLAIGVVATGLAMITSRLINGNPGGGDPGAQASQGTRVQLTPDTKHKIPVIYGQGYFSSIITDAYLHNQNKTMTYVMVIGETTNQRSTFRASISGTTMTVTTGYSGTIHLGMTVGGASSGTVIEEFLGGTYGGTGTYRVNNSQAMAAKDVTGYFPYTVNDIYWNDLRLEFDSGANGHKALRGKKKVDGPGEDFTDENFKDLVEVYVYAGNSTAANMIHGPSTAKDAYQVIGAGDQWLSPSTTNAERMEGLIFAVVRVTYNAEKSFTGLGQMTFKITNALNNPAAVLYDYMNSDRYGGNVAGSDINGYALGQFANYCNQTVTYTDVDNNTTSGRRYQINGLLDTNQNVKQNIDTILMNSGAWMAYDVHAGQWRVIPKRAEDNVLLFTDDNIVGGMSINSTRLDDLYNIAEIEYYDKLNKDQKAFHSIEVNSSLRNYNEPDNAMRLVLDLCNSNVQAERIANLELKQARDDVLVVFKSTHYGLQAQAGDVVSVYNQLYGWCEPTYPAGKKFRVIRVKEAEGEEGGIYAEITALEYNADVYTDENITEFTTEANIGIIPRNSSKNIPAPIVGIPGNGIDNTGGVPHFGVAITIPSEGGPYDIVELWAAEGDDWAGVGGDLTFRGQIAGNKLYVITWNGPNVIRSILESGVGTEISGTGVITGTKVQAFGATASPYYGNGMTGYYTVDTNHPTNTGIRTMTGTVNDAKFTGYIVGTTLTVTTKTLGTIQANSLIKGGAILNDTVILSQATGTTGGVGTYIVNKTQNTGSAGSPISIVSKKPYPAPSTYFKVKDIKPKPGSETLLFDRGELRENFISALPANAPNKKYFIKARLGIDGNFGPFSELSEVDLEAPTVYWEPDSFSALNIKEELVKIDFGKFTIPRNGLWVMRTATQLDGGRFGPVNGDYFNMDLGNLDEEQQIASTDDIATFTFDPND